MKKQMKVLTGETSRALVSEVNNKHISKDDIVSLIWRDGQFLLFYYE